MRCTPRVVALLFLLGVAATGNAELRLEGADGSRVLLRPVEVEDTTAWYDAEAWLRQYPGVVEWQPDPAQLTYRDGSHWAALRPSPPYAVRDGQPLADAPPVRLRGTRLLVSTEFLRTVGGAFLGRPLRVVSDQDRPRRVVLDPGHGGGDAGSRGPGGLREKTVTLELARALQQRLQAAGYRVFLTRDGDHDVAAAKRAALANYREADLFLSLHCAGAARPQARGFEVFVAPPPDAALPASAWGAGQRSFGAASQRWAEVLRAVLGERLATFDRGLGVLAQPTLEAVTAAAALLEIGNLAWPHESELLTTPGGRTTLATTLATAVERYFANP